MFQPTWHQERQAAVEAFEPSYVFVYGTLKRHGIANDCLLRSGGHFCGESELAGVELFLLPAGFPAAVLDPTGVAVAKGEIWRVERLYELDHLEGNGRHYWRVKRSFLLGDEIITAWIYIYLFPINQIAMPLVTGDYPVSADDPNGLEVVNLIAEWATAFGYKSEYGWTGFDTYSLDDPMCWEACDECPYEQLGVVCQHRE